MSLEAELRVIQAIAFDFDGVFTDDRVLVSENGGNQSFAVAPTVWESRPFGNLVFQ